MNLIRQSWVIFTRRYLRELYRQPVVIFMALLQPIIWLLLFDALSKKVVEIPGFGTGNYVTYLTPGVVRAGIDARDRDRRGSVHRSRRPRDHGGLAQIRAISCSRPDKLTRSSRAQRRRARVSAAMYFALALAAVVIGDRGHSAGALAPTR
jgi:hypothetical protein